MIMVLMRIGIVLNLNKQNNAMKNPLSLKELKAINPKVKNVNVEFNSDIKPLDKFAVNITKIAGSIFFFLVVFLGTNIWLLWNIFVYEEYKFDPAPAFVLWLFISNFIQLMFMPLLMVGQNILGRHAEARAENDYVVNTKTEQEVEAVLEHLEYQNKILIKLGEKLGVDFSDSDC